MVEIALIVLLVVVSIAQRVVIVRLRKHNEEMYEYFVVEMNTTRYILGQANETIRKLKSNQES